MEEWSKIPAAVCANLIKNYRKRLISPGGSARAHNCVQQVAVTLNKDGLATCPGCTLCLAGGRHQPFETRQGQADPSNG
ncbi:hypothetical protein CRENBAI_022393 [Crenichthys baileyi]|uniref:Uncharacterized protein n=1 Tax=Crenichthys baileyi TaxID=28760 RepID=A0AAV9RLU8_9TELE